MLRDLSIQNYRSFRSFQVGDLAQVNLFVGMNNSGKTSLLEAIYLLVSQGTPQCMAEILYNRGEISERLVGSRVPGDSVRRSTSYQVGHIFYGHQPRLSQTMTLASRKDRPLSLTITLMRSSKQVELFRDDMDESELSELELLFSYRDGEGISIPVRSDGTIEIRSFRLAPRELHHHHFLTTEKLSFSDLADLWDGITLTPKEDKVVEALQILESSVERISFTSRQTSNTGILLKLRGQLEPIPLGSMGDGMRRILTLATSAVMAEDGVLLIDEVDTGLYYRTQTDMWRLLLDTAKRLNVQIFATTHSLDCVRAFQEALSLSEDKSTGKLFRLSLRDKAAIHPVAYTADQLEVAISQEIEVR